MSTYKVSLRFSNNNIPAGTWEVRGVVWKKTEWQFVASKQLYEGMMGCNLGEIKPFRKEDITFMLLCYKIGVPANKNIIQSRSGLCGFSCRFVY